MSYKKPPLPTIRINGKIYIKQIDVDCLRVSFYRCADPKLEVRIYWCQALSKFRAFGGNHDFTIEQDLTDNLRIPVSHISNYFTSSQEKAMDKLVTQTLLASERK